MSSNCSVLAYLDPYACMVQFHLVNVEKAGLAGYNCVGLLLLGSLFLCLNLFNDLPFCPAKGQEFMVLQSNK